MTVRSAWLTSPGQTREDTRRAPIGAFTSVDASRVRSGVVPGGTPYALASTGAMTFTIGLGRAVIQGTLAQGAYGHVVTATEAFTVGAGHASLPRIDSVYAVVYDQLYDSSGQTAAAVVLVAGTPASSPVAPAAPTGSALKLYDIAVPAGASSGTGGLNWGTAITDRRVYTVGVGGINPGGTDVVGTYAGQWRDNGGVLERYDGTAWTTRQPHAGGTYEADLALGATRKLLFGADINLYRGAANQLKTDDDFQAANFPAGAWQTWSPTWSTTTGANISTWGNAIRVCRYTKIGRTVFLTMNISFGSSTVFRGDTGDNWTFTVPVPAAQADLSIGFAAMYAGSTTHATAGMAHLYDTTRFYLTTQSASINGASDMNGGIADSLSPKTWRTTDSFTVVGHYEAAA